MRGLRMASKLAAPAKICVLLSRLVKQNWTCQTLKFKLQESLVVRFSQTLRLSSHLKILCATGAGAVEQRCQKHHHDSNGLTGTETLKRDEKGLLTLECNRIWSKGLVRNWKFMPEAERSFGKLTIKRLWYVDYADMFIHGRLLAQTGLCA